MSISRRSFLAAGAAVVSAPTLGRVQLFAQQPAAQPSFKSIRGNVGYMTGRGGTVGWLVTGGGTLVVDTQYPDTAEAIVGGLTQISKGQPFMAVINTHHHGDHTSGNVLFKDTARQIVGHQNVPELMRQAAARRPSNPPAEIVVPNTTFTDRWTYALGNEEIIVRHYTPAHTAGDAVITFERNNVAHVGDLVFNGRHPFIDRAGGADIQGWIRFLKRIVSDHDAQTVFIFGHAREGLEVTGRRAEVQAMEAYLGALVDYVEREVKAGKTREEVVKAGHVLKGFEGHGPLTDHTVGAAYDDVTNAPRNQ